MYDDVVRVDIFRKAYKTTDKGIKVETVEIKGTESKTIELEQNGIYYAVEQAIANYTASYSADVEITDTTYTGAITVTNTYRAPIIDDEDEEIIPVLPTNPKEENILEENIPLVSPEKPVETPSTEPEDIVVAIKLRKKGVE